MSQPCNLIQPSRANGNDVMAATGARNRSSLRWLIERSKKFGILQSALDWIQERSETVENAPFGDNRKCRFY